MPLDQSLGASVSTSVGTCRRCKHTAALLYGGRVVVRDVVVDPGQIPIRLFRRVCFLQAVQPVSNDVVAEQAWQKADLQSEPVFRLTDVQDVAGVCSAGYAWSVCEGVSSTRSG